MSQSQLDELDITRANFSYLLPPGINGVSAFPNASECASLQTCMNASENGCIVTPDVFLPFAEEALDSIALAALDAFSFRVNWGDRNCPSWSGDAGMQTAEQARLHAILCPADIALRLQEGPMRHVPVPANGPVKLP